MVEPTWTDKLEAITSLITAIATTLSLIFIAVYTTTTKKMQQTNRDIYDEGNRPVLILDRVRKANGLKVGVLRNTGVGTAIKIRRKTVTGFDELSSNVVARGRLLLIPLPLHETQILDIRYESLTGKNLCTICYFDDDGRAFNEYVPDAARLKDFDLQQCYTAIVTRATYARSVRFLAKASRFRRLD